jgi:hypothetical protein
VSLNQNGESYLNGQQSSGSEADANEQRKVQEGPRDAEVTVATYSVQFLGRTFHVKVGPFQREGQEERNQRTSTK